METDIHPKNYFSPYEDLQEFGEDPLEVKADKQAAQIIERLQKSAETHSQGISHPTDYRTMFYKLLSLAELEFAELLEYSYKLEEKN